MPSYKFNVAMTCSGCSTSITKVLENLQKQGSIDSFVVSLETKKVTVVSKTLSEQELLKILNDTGKVTTIATD
ncbi:hypothetical protein BGX27_002874 [Mortierella sp. AM989]|nr:hypothetical protein BGX27_002874 [Mortierella sp. AM989]